MKKRVIFIFLILVLFVMALSGFFYKNYRDAILEQEEFFNRQQLMQVNLRANSIQEILETLKKNNEFFAKYILNEYFEGNVSKKDLEHIFLKNMGIYEGLITTVAFYKDGKEELNINIDSEASLWAKKLYRTYEDMEREFFIPDFRLSHESQLMSYIYKIKENYFFIIVIDFSKLSKKYIKQMKSGKYGEPFLLDEKGYVIYDHEKEIISRNIFDIHKNYPSLLEVDKRYLGTDSGYSDYKFIVDRKTNKETRKLTAWKSIEIGNKKMVLCLAAPDFEIYYIIKNFLNNNVLTDIIFIMFICVLFLAFFYYLEQNKKHKINKILNKEKERFELAINGVNDGIWDWEIEKDSIYLSKEWKAILKYSDEEIENSMESWKGLIHKNDLEDFEKAIEEAVENYENVFQMEYRMREKSERYRWILTKAKIIYNEEKELKRMVGYNTDINQSKSMEKNLRIFYKAIDQSWAGIVVTDKNGIIDYINSSFTEITGYRIEEVIGKNINIISSGQHTREFYKELWTTIKQGKQWVGEIINRRKSGEIYYEKTSISPIKNAKGEIENYVAIKEDISKNKELENELKFYATKDTLTGVLNRRTGIEFLNKQMQLAKRKGEKVSIIFADVNDLKKVNDSLGHNFGDELIITVSEVFERNLRESDIISRLGGDEFLIILPDCDTVNSEKIWLKICSDFDKINGENNREYKIVVSHGVEEYNCKRELSAEELIEKADKKMYEEKRRLKQIKETLD